MAEPHLLQMQMMNSSICAGMLNTTLFSTLEHFAKRAVSNNELGQVVTLLLYSKTICWRLPLILGNVAEVNQNEDKPTQKIISVLVARSCHWGFVLV